MPINYNVLLKNQGYIDEYFYSIVSKFSLRCHGLSNISFEVARANYLQVL